MHSSLLAPTDTPSLFAATSAARSHERGPTHPPLLDQTIGERLSRTVARFGAREAVVVRHQSYRATWSELADEVELAARALIARGVRKGDRVGIWAANRYEWIVVQLATARVGAILVTINPAYRPKELRYALSKAGVRLLVMAAGFRQSDYVAMLKQARSGCPELTDVIVLEDDWQAFLELGARVEHRQLVQREAELCPDDPINIQFTSGTTGAPKGATLSHRNILNNAYFTARALRYSELDRVCSPVPFYHCFGMVLATLACMTHGACVVIPGESFDAEDVLAAVEAERCTSLYGVPTMFIDELEHPDFDDFDLTTLRTGIMAGAPCPVEVMKQVRSRMHMREVTIACGMTETSPLSTQTAVDDPIEVQVTTVGRVHPHVEVKVVDPETGETVARGTAGEQCTRGYSVMAGYWDDPDATVSAIDSDGWMHTGDMAVMNDGGYLRIVGRIKDMIIRGGENISPREIEEFLYEFPEVLDVQVIGVPSERYGEEVMAWVRLRDGSSLTDQELVDRCRGRIASYKIPRHWRFVDAFPMTVSGKVQKYRLRQIATEELGRQATAETAAV
jgi:fatty-acyl-CoA synthase